ncbi:MAG: hypothetical protein A2044_02570 [Candidatus Firestonebacteria bacterium GWA2_43_8]|nr:MAG: hypothetical protein A2044_02570 [Candidatus Firestonebacteria bacterium GWA2_43_8]
MDEKKMRPRYLEAAATADLDRKMVFIGGPRQVGKTTFAEQLGEKYYGDKYQYLNWDSRQDRKQILNEEFDTKNKYIIFDEIHKYKNWKNYIKGIYDKNKSDLKIAVTGSSRLDIYRKGGDSLLGRYRYYRLHPFSAAEIMGTKYNGVPLKDNPDYKGKNVDGKIFERLWKFGGFPEVYINQDEKGLRRWHNERSDRVIKEDIRDIEVIKDISAMQVLVEILRGKVSSELSIESLVEDLKLSYKTIQNWLDILARFYYIYRITPYRSLKIRSLRKKTKLYLWDWSELESEGARLENIVASHLLKFVDYLYDAEGYKAELHFIKDKDQRETDFIVTIDNKPWFAVEVKASYKEIPQSLRYFTEKIGIPASYLVVMEPNKDMMIKGIRVISIDKFLSGLV